MSKHVPLTVEERNQLVELKNKTVNLIADIRTGNEDAKVVLAQGPALLAAAKRQLADIEARLLQNFCAGDGERADAIRVHQTRRGLGGRRPT